MAIRIRQVGDELVALCAARTNAEAGDLYLDDGVHHALSSKFAVDFQEEGFIKVDIAEPEKRKIMAEVEIV